MGMLKKSLRLAIAFMTAASAAFLSAGSAPVAAGAVSTGTLFGLAQNTVLKIDPATGASQTFVNLPTVATFPGSSYNDIASDAAGHLLFLQRTVYTQDPTGLIVTYQIVTVSSSDPNAAPVVSPDMTTGVTQLVFDPSSRTLFAQTNMYPFQVVSIDPATGVETHVADIPGLQPLFMAAAPNHTIYMPIEDFSVWPPVNRIATIDTMTGAVSQQPLSMGIFALEYDSTSGVLYGKTFCCPAAIVQVDPTTGAETAIASNVGIGPGITIDSSSHRIYMTDDEQGAYSLDQFIQTVDLQGHTSTKSTGTLPANQYVGALVFEGVAITPDSIIADVQGALASGAISDPGVAGSLVAKLNAAKAARLRGQCGAAAAVYQAFINEVDTQSGKAVAAPTASQLVSEAQSLIANCP